MKGNRQAKSHPYGDCEKLHCVKCNPERLENLRPRVPHAWNARTFGAFRRERSAC